MSAASALGYLLLASARGRVRQLARRLRSPRHFFGILVGAAWLLYLVASNRVGIGQVLERQGTFDAAWLVELFAMVALGLPVLIAWVFACEGAALGFTEAETHLLFAAPLTRRQLVAYKLAQSGLSTLVVVAVVSTVFARGGGAHRALFAAGLWVALVTSSLHVTGATLTRAALAQHGVSAVRRRLVTLAVASAVPVAAAVGWWRAPPLEAFPAGVAGFADWTRALLDTFPLSWAVYPVRVSLDAAFASSAEAFRAAFPFALAVLALHVAWVFSSDAAFEDAAIENARKLSVRLEAMRSGAFPMARRGKRRRSFALRAEGRPEAALAWKALVRATRVVSIPLVAGGAALAMSLAAAVLVGGGDDGPGPSAFVGVFALVFFAMAVLLGPNLFSGDLRRDAPHLELLRALPLGGRQVLVGEIAVPFAQTAVVQWLLVALWYAFAATLFPGSREDQLAFAVAMAVGGPAVSAAAFVIANGLVVLYPDWAGKPAGGQTPLEVLGGQRLLNLATMALTAVALVPAAVAGGLVGAAAWPIVGPWAAPAAALAGAATIAIGAAFALRLLGRAFERLDASA